MSIIKVKQKDTARGITDTLTLGGSAIDLTGGSVVLVWRSGKTVTRKTATIVTAADGTVSYALVAGDVATAGTVFFEWEVTLAGGGIITIPTDKPHTLQILADLEE